MPRFVLAHRSNEGYDRGETGHTTNGTMFAIRHNNYIAIVELK